MDIDYFFENNNDFNYFNFELKLGNYKNNYFNYNIDKNIFDKIFKFYNNKYESKYYEYRRYEYIDLILIEKEKTFNCYKNINLNYNYVNLENINLQIKNYLYIDVDIIYFPKVKSVYHEDIKCYYFLIKFKNSIIRIEFLNINNKYNSIVIKLSEINDKIKELLKLELSNINIHYIQ